MLKNIIILLSLLLFAVTPVMAADFDTISTITYQFNENGNCKVTNAITLVNQVDDRYVSEYTITLADPQVTNFSASDAKGKIIPEVDKTNTKTIIKLKLNEAVVGKNQLNSFVIKYETPNLIRTIGINREITLPGIAQGDNYLDYQVVVNVPTTFGDLTSIKPEANEIIKHNDLTVYTFNRKEQLTNGVFMLFGDYQLYEVNWQADLVNTDSNTQLFKFPIIADTDYQETYQKSINPLPDDIEQDEDGNWLVYYRLTAGASIKVTGTTLVKVYPGSRKHSQINADQLKVYLKPTDYWPINDPTINKIAASLTDIESVYQYVINQLSYDSDDIRFNRQRYGAIDALKYPNKAVCSEYTDLFIALARKIGVPSRRHEGFAFSQNTKLKELYENTDVLHAWPEYYDQSTNQWRMVDPTFEDTSGGLDYFSNFDNSHITFVVHGINDQHPIPLGAYRHLNNKTKQIQVNVQSFTNLPEPNDITVDTNNFYASFNPLAKFFDRMRNQSEKQGPYFSLLSQPINFTVVNTTGYPTKLNPQSKSDILFFTQTSGQLLPWQKYQLGGLFRPPDKFKNFVYFGSYNLNDQAVYFSASIISTSVIVYIAIAVLGLIFFYVVLGQIRKYNQIKNSHEINS